MSYNQGILESFKIHPNMGYPLAPQILEILRQMGYMTQFYEALDVTNESMSLPIDNFHRLL